MEDSRAIETNTMFGVGVIQKGIPHTIELIFTWLIFAIIGIGILILILRFKEMSIPELNFKKPYFLIKKFEVGFSIIVFICVGLLLLIIIIPFVSIGYSMDRLYALTNIILSMFFVIGGVILSKYLIISLSNLHSKWWNENISQTRMSLILLLLILIPYFLCVTGVMYNIFGVPKAIILNSEGDQYDQMYIHDQESYGAKWLKNNTYETDKIYSDFYGTSRLTSQGLIYSPKYFEIFAENERQNEDGYIFLRYKSVVNGKWLDRQSKWHNIDFKEEFGKNNKIYTNGGSDVWK